MDRIDRRDFLKRAAGTLGAAAEISHLPAFAAEQSTDAPVHDRAQQGGATARHASEKIAFPRVFSGGELKMLAFPLGGVGSGSLALGGRG